MAPGRFERLMASSDRDVPTSRAVVRLIGTGVRLTRELDEALSPAGLSIRQFIVLMELASSPDGTRPQSHLMSRAQSSAPNMSALISRMEASGFVRKRRDPDDQRLVHVEISEEGWERLAAGAPLLIAAEKALMSALSQAELERLSVLLGKV